MLLNERINQQGFSYRQGLVLGLTMAEIMLLLVFCLLIAMATFVRSEQTKLAHVRQQLKEQTTRNEQNEAVISNLRQELAEKLSQIPGANKGATDEYWRDLVASRVELDKLKAEGTSLKELKEKAAQLAALQNSGLNAGKVKRDAEIVAAIERTLPAETKVTPQTVAGLLKPASSTSTEDKAGHQWPPIISLSEAGGYTFKTGSAELSGPFREALMSTTPDAILNYIKRFNVDVIEVVGHTDEQAFGVHTLPPATTGPVPLVPPPVRLRSSNLDRGLGPFLKNGGDISRLTPADNAGLGLARAVSVVSVLRLSPKLSGYKMIPLSGGQLINTDETLALDGKSSGDIAQRRRIEIRLRKSAPHEAATAIATVPVIRKPPVSAINQIPAKPSVRLPSAAPPKRVFPTTILGIAPR